MTFKVLTAVTQNYFPFCSYLNVRKHSQKYQQAFTSQQHYLAT